MNVMKLVKLLYLADRRALVLHGTPITYDAFVSMPHGPVVSGILNLINEEPDSDGPRYWHRHVSERQGYAVKLLADPGTPSLSPAEESILAEVYDAFGGMDRYALRDWCHENLPEWQDPNGSSIPIRVRDILVSEGYSEDEAHAVEVSVLHIAAAAAELGA